MRAAEVVALDAGVVVEGDVVGEGALDAVFAGGAGDEVVEAGDAVGAGGIGAVGEGGCRLPFLDYGVHGGSGMCVRCV